MPAWVDMVKCNLSNGKTEPEVMDELAWTLDLEERTGDDDFATTDFKSLLQLLESDGSDSEEARQQLDFMVSMLATRLNGMCLFLTNSGRMGLGQEDCQVGDHVALISGPRLPFVLRQDGANFKLVGWSFVYGIMYGQAWPGEASLQDITLA